MIVESSFIIVFIKIMFSSLIVNVIKEKQIKQQFIMARQKYVFIVKEI